MNKKALIVEDDPTLLVVIGDKLKREGWPPGKWFFWII